MKPVLVVSNTDSVAVFLNGKPLPACERKYEFLFSIDKVKWEAGTLLAIGYNNGQEVSRYQLETAGEPQSLRLTKIENEKGWKADGHDLVLAQVEVVDAQGRRCPLANDRIRFSLNGPAEYRGGTAQGPGNSILATTLPVEAGVNRVLIRSTLEAGHVTLRAEADGLQHAEISFTSIPIEMKNGLSDYIPGDELSGRLDRGETPLTPSYTDKAVTVDVVSAKAGCNTEQAVNSWDDNELSEWKNDGRLSTAWITYQLARRATIDDVCLKLTGWRMRSYPLEIYADDELIWSGDTEKSLGYIHLNVKPVTARTITIRLKGSTLDNDSFGGIVEVAEPAAGELDLFKAKGGEETKNELRIVEVDFLEKIQ